MTADTISLSFPRERPFHGVARLVVGGLAARLDFSYEHLDDLRLALDSVLEADAHLAGEDVTVRLVVRPDSVGMTIGPIDPDVNLDPAGPADAGISLARVLSNLVEDVAVERAEGAQWLRLEKRMPTAQAGAGETAG